MSGLDYNLLKNWPFEEVIQTYTERDTILYALGVGVGSDPMDEKQLDFVFEERSKFSALPWMSVILSRPGHWFRDPNTGVDWKKILHGEQNIEMHAPLPVAGTVRATSRVDGIVDKGVDKGALFYVTRDIYNADNDELLATVTTTSFARGNGGFDGPATPAKPVHKLPDREPDTVCDLSTTKNLALLYRLSGDTNPIHACPETARTAGFNVPILHGLCTLGIAAHAVLRTCCEYKTEQMRSLDLRFSAPVYPGETIRTEIWQDNQTVSFRARSVERDIVVLNNGKVTVSSK